MEKRGRGQVPLNLQQVYMSIAMFTEISSKYLKFVVMSRRLLNLFSKHIQKQSGHARISCMKKTMGLL